MLSDDSELDADKCENGAAGAGIPPNVPSVGIPGYKRYGRGFCNAAAAAACLLIYFEMKKNMKSIIELMNWYYTKVFISSAFVFNKCLVLQICAKNLPVI